MEKNDDDCSLELLVERMRFDTQHDFEMVRTLLKLHREQIDLLRVKVRNIELVLELFRPPEVLEDVLLDVV